MRLNQVTAATHDLDASIAFYELLGLVLIVKSEHYARFELPLGEATFSLHAVETAIPRENAPQLYFEVNNVDFEVRRLKHAGVAIEREPTQQSWLWYEAWLRDPAGNQICLFNAGANRRHPPWRINTAPGAKNLHVVIRDDSSLVIVKHDGAAETWRALQERHVGYKASLGPFDRFGLLALLEHEWLEDFLEHEEKIRAFFESDDSKLEL